MSFRELSMIDVRELLRRRATGDSARQIDRAGIVDRKTAGRYFDAAEELGVTATTELTDEVVAQVALRVQERPRPAPSAEWRQLEQQRDRIEAWLKGPPPLRLVRVKELLARDAIVTSYTMLRRFAHQELGWRERRTTVRLDDPPPAEEAQIDFGLMGYVNAKEGRRKLWVLLVTLTMSRYMFVWPTFTQTIEAVCDGLDAAWKFFGGIPRRIIPDNMSAIVTRAHAQAPVLQRAFLEYAQSRSFFVDPARVRHPQDKARVENQVPYVRERWFEGEVFSDDLEILRDSAASWCRDVAGTRVHGTTRAVPRDVYERDELPRMQPPPTARFDVPVWSRAKVHPDHHVQIARALYSVPTRYVGRVVDARVDRATVRLFAAGELIKMHPRALPGKRCTDPSDYPQEKAEYALRSVDGVKTRAHLRGRHIGAYADRLLGGPLPWTKMRQAYGLLRLCDRYGAERVNALCEKALAFDVVDVVRIERMLRDAHSVEVEAEKTGKVTRLPAGPARFARDVASFSTRRGPSSTGGV
jgi:transposase